MKVPGSNGKGQTSTSMAQGKVWWKESADGTFSPMYECLPNMPLRIVQMHGIFSSCPWNFNKLPPLKMGGWLKRGRISFLKSLWNSILLFNQLSEYLLVPVSVHHRVQDRNDATNKLSCSKNKLEPNLHNGKMQTHSTCSQAKIFHCGLVATI